MKAVKYYIFFTLIIATITSCNYQNNKLSIIKSNGLEADNFGIQTMFFYDKDTGFIGGSSDIITHNPDENSNQFAFVNKTALLYKTTDGGYTWRENKFGEGSFQNILYNEGKYYAFKIKENYYTDIYCSEDFGRNWRVKTSFPNVVTDLFFIKEQIVIVAKDERRVFQFFVSNNGGLNWVKRTSTYSPIYDIIKSEESNFYYLSSKNNKKLYLI